MGLEDSRRCMSGADECASIAMWLQVSCLEGALGKIRSRNAEFRGSDIPVRGASRREKLLGLLLAGCEGYRQQRLSVFKGNASVNLSACGSPRKPTQQYTWWTGETLKTLSDNLSQNLEPLVCPFLGKQIRRFTITTRISTFMGYLAVSTRHPRTTKYYLPDEAQ
jgi:hypothetical protein